MREKKGEEKEKRKESCSPISLTLLDKFRLEPFLVRFDDNCNFGRNYPREETIFGRNQGSGRSFFLPLWREKKKNRSNFVIDRARDDVMIDDSSNRGSSRKRERKKWREKRYPRCRNPENEISKRSWKRFKEEEEEEEKNACRVGTQLHG